MSSRLDLILQLLHTGESAALATHSLTLPGFPFVSSLPYAPDQQHCPAFLISRLAEHTQNLQHDARASLLLRAAGNGADVARVTIVGKIRPLETDELLVARYLRYQPEAEFFLQLGDFRFYRLEPLRIRTIGGFAQAGWLDGERLVQAPALPLAEEAAWIERLRGEVPKGIELLGIDRFGTDLRHDGRRLRRAFAAGPLDGEALGVAVAEQLAILG